MPNPLPRWRGFNLLEMFTTRSHDPFREEDFQWLADWGFNWVRIPLCYTLWTAPDDPMAILHDALARVDQVIALGQRYNIHINLNFHRAPGYSVSGERREPFDLWKDPAALNAFCLHWQTFAQRYRSVPVEQLSFNLVNEPPAPTPNGMRKSDHYRVMHAGVAAVRAVDPQRLIMIDGLAHGNMPLGTAFSADLSAMGRPVSPGAPPYAGLVGQSTRGYRPGGLSHYRAPWAGGDRYPMPAWPGALDWDATTPWSRETLEAFYDPWAQLAAAGVPIHCGEMGAFKFTPHAVVLAWMRDVLEVLRKSNIGWALWNFRGTFGVLDSERDDVHYENWHGHKLDRQMLELIRAM